MRHSAYFIAYMHPSQTSPLHKRCASVWQVCDAMTPRGELRLKCKVDRWSYNYFRFREFLTTYIHTEYIYNNHFQRKHIIHTSWFRLCARIALVELCNSLDMRPKHTSACVVCCASCVNELIGYTATPHVFLLLP